MSAGDTVTLGYDGAANFTVTFLAADSTATLCVARINAAAGFTFATVVSSQITLTGRTLGMAGQVRVVSASSGVLTKLGMGTGPTYSVGTYTAATAVASPGTASSAFQDITAITPTELKTTIQAGFAYALVDFLSDGRIRIANTNPSASSTPSITVGPLTTATALGFTLSSTQSVAIPTSGKIPAGTVVKQGSSPNQLFVLQQDIQFAAGGTSIGGLTVTTAGPWSVKVRHATDDGTGVSATASSVNTVPNPVTILAFSVTNPLNISACLTEAAIDAAYVTALNATLDPATVAAQTNIIFSARQSNAIRKQLRQNALDASANGLFGRCAIVRPPLGTTKTAAQSTSAEPGVGAYRDQRVFYVWPGANTFVPIVASRGTGGGTGFTASGNIDVGLDGFLASVCSQLAPEENPGQKTDFMNAVNSMDTQALAQGALNIDDYKAFKKAGIVALRMDDGTPIFQSGVTSVDPTLYPSLVRIARRRMADYIQDSIGRRSKSYGKKLSTAARRNALSSEIRQFLENLLGVNAPGSQRIGGFTVDSKNGNTADILAAGLFRIIINVRTLSSLDSIVLATTIGDLVQVEETLPRAA
jgi:hypothetical protein